MIVGGFVQSRFDNNRSREYTASSILSLLDVWADEGRVAGGLGCCLQSGDTREGCNGIAANDDATAVNSTAPSWFLLAVAAALQPEQKPVDAVGDTATWEIPLNARKAASLSYVSLPCSHGISIPPLSSLAPLAITISLHGFPVYPCLLLTFPLTLFLFLFLSLSFFTLLFAITLLSPPFFVVSPLSLFLLHNLLFFSLSPSRCFFPLHPFLFALYCSLSPRRIFLYILIRY